MHIVTTRSFIELLYEIFNKTLKALTLLTMCSCFHITLYAQQSTTNSVYRWADPRQINRSSISMSLIRPVIFLHHLSSEKIQMSKAEAFQLNPFRYQRYETYRCEVSGGTLSVLVPHEKSRVAHVPHNHEKWESSVVAEWVN